MVVPGRSSSARFEVRPTADSHFSWLRTRMSIERTLMAWVRTATALIGFGFTIVQFLERLDARPDVAAALLPKAPRYVGLALIVTGTLALIVAVSQYRRLLRYMWQPGFRTLAGVDEDRSWYPPILVVACLLILIGIFAFTAVFLRIS